MLLASFLAYATRMTANQAILYVRAKRPNSIQTRGQLRCVREFAQFLVPLRSVFSCAEPRSNPVTLSQYLNRQRHILHGTERRELRHMPKIVQLVSKLLMDIVENRQVIEEDILEAPDIHDIEMTLSIIEQMGPEIFSKEPRLPGTPTLPRHYNEPPIFYHRKSLSYSESDLRRLGSQLNLLTQPLGSLSQSNINASVCQSESANRARERNSNVSDFSHGSTGSLWKMKNEQNKDDSIVLRRMKKKTIQRSESMGNKKPNGNNGSMLTRWKAEQREGLAINGIKYQGSKEEHSEVPFITLQSELSLEARRILVAQSLAVDLLLDGEEEHKNKLLAWQVNNTRQKYKVQTEKCFFLIQMYKLYFFPFYFFLHLGMVIRCYFMQIFNHNHRRSVFFFFIRSKNKNLHGSLIIKISTVKSHSSILPASTIKHFKSVCVAFHDGSAFFSL